MIWAVFTETLLRGWRTMLFWGIGIGLAAVLAVIAVPSVDGMKATAEALAKMPPFILQMVGGGDLTFLASPAGYLNNQFYAISLVFFGIYAIIVGLNVTANEETKGMMDVMLSTPLPRWRVIVEKLLAYSVLAAGAITISTIAIILSIQITPAATIPIQTLIEVSVNILPGTIMMLAFTAFIATLVRRRGQAAGIAVVFLIASWIIDVLGRTATTTFANSLRAISFYAYFDTEWVFQHGMLWGNVVVVLVAAVILAGASIWFFQRRDIAV